MGGWPEGGSPEDRKVTMGWRASEAQMLYLETCYGKSYPYKVC